jgi:hypothetical protein
MVNGFSYLIKSTPVGRNFSRRVKAFNADG